MEFVRRASSDELDVLLPLYETSVKGLEAGRGAEMFGVRESFANPQEAIGSLLHDPLALALLSGIDDVVLGLALSHCETIRTGEKHIIIDALYVDPDARKVGLGEAMMDQIIAWAKEQGAKTLDAHALPGDRNTKNFFEMSGFKARLIVMHHEL